MIKRLLILLAVCASPLFAANPVITTLSLPAARVGVAYSTTLVATSGTAPYSWSMNLVSDPLPPGLSLSAGGVISGTPTLSGTFAFAVMVTDSLAHTNVQSYFLSTQGIGIDQYGGRTDITGTNTGWFHAQKIGSHWHLIDPLGNDFFFEGVEQVVYSIDSTYTATMNAKYGNAANWAIDINQRLLSWGFNSLTTGSYATARALGTNSNYPLDINGIRSQPIKLPFTLSIRPGFGAMNNTTSGNGLPLANPVKNMMYSHSAKYTGFVPSGGNPDFEDTNISTWMVDDFGVSSDWVGISTSPYLNYVVGATVEDADEMFGMDAGPDFITPDGSNNNYNTAFQVATMSPVQTANSVLGFVYANTTVFSKAAWSTYLSNKYVTIGALNTAWGSSYTTFGSSGTTITGELVGTGDGTTLTFPTHTLANLTPSRFSVQILVAGTPVGGDTGGGTIYGKNLTASTVNYTTGAVSITFTAGNAPASGAAITVNYVQNGWEIGTGILDEDDRVSHQGWMGNDFIFLSNTNATVKSDINTFFEQMAEFYFKECHDDLKAAFPNMMYLGPDSLGTHAVPPPAPVLQAAGKYMDAFILNGVVPFTQAMQDYIETNAGDKPYIGGFYTFANPDSALSAFPNLNNFAGYSSQVPRGKAYYDLANAMLNTAHTTSGNFPYIGIIYWELIDNFSEKVNWGMITHFDNAYDGSEPSSSALACSPPLQSFTCGSEPTPAGGGIPPFGNLIGGSATGLTSGNFLWLSSTMATPTLAPGRQMILPGYLPLLF